MGRRERRRAAKGCGTVRLGGQVFHLVPDWPRRVAQIEQELPPGDEPGTRRWDGPGFVDLVEAMFGERSRDVLAAGLTVDDLQAIGRNNRPGDRP